jgi:O-antigen/teichoic acid export membrane protein
LVTGELAQKTENIMNIRRRSLLHPSHDNFKQAIPGDSESVVLDTPPTLKISDIYVQQSVQLQNHQKERQKHSFLQRIHLLPTAEEPISNLATVLMFATRPQDVGQQKDMYINSLVEDVTNHITLQLPAIVSETENRTQPDQRQVITSTASSAAVAGLGDLISSVLKYVTNVAMTNFVSQSIFGIYITVYAAATIFGSIIVFGLDLTTVRFLSTYRAKGERGLALGLIRFVVWMTLITGLLCGTMFYLSATVLAHLVYHQDLYILPLREIALLVPLIALQPVLASGLMALKAIKWKVYTDRLIQPGVSLVLMGIFYLLGLRLEALILATICGFLASVIVGQLFLGKASKFLVCDTAPRFELRTWLRFALPLSFNSFIQNILNSTDVLFLGAFASAAQVGLYAAADRVSFVVLMPLIALNTIFSPLIAEYYGHEEHEQLANLSKVVTKWAFSLSLPMFLCFCVFHEAILSIFSKEYTSAGIVLIILSLANFIAAGVGSTGDLLVMTGHTRVILANTVVSITVNIGLSFLLVPRFNVIGAAVASALGLAIPNIAGFFEVYWILKILTFRLDMLKSVLAGVVASLVGILLLHFIHVSYGFKAIIGILCLVIPFMLVYVLVLALLRFSKEDLMVFDTVRIRFVKKQVR